MPSRACRPWLLSLCLTVGVACDDPGRDTSAGRASTSASGPSTGERTRAAPTPDARSMELAIDPATLRSRVLDARTAPLLFPALRREHSRMIFDEQAVMVLEPDRDFVYALAEHPAGQVAMSTNDRGFREDGPLPPPGGHLRILALGDSHTDGTVDNAATWPNVLEGLLLGSGRPAAVFNAGVGGTGPHNHLGMLRKHGGLKLDMVIVAFYVGNDFLNAMSVKDFFVKRRLRERDRSYTERILTVAQTHGIIVAQGFNQAYRFDAMPEDGQVGLAAAVEAYLAMDGLCDELGIPLVVAALPTKAEVDLDDDRERVAALWSALGVEDGVAINTRLTDELLAALDAAGITTVDPRPAMRADPRPLYWRQDHHLNVDGQALFAGQLLAPVTALLED